MSSQELLRVRQGPRRVSICCKFEVEGVDIVPNVLAGIGYALVSSVDVDLAVFFFFRFSA